MSVVATCSRLAGGGPRGSKSVVATVGHCAMVSNSGRGGGTGCTRNTKVIVKVHGQHEHSFSTLQPKRFSTTTTTKPSSSPSSSSSTTTAANTIPGMGRRSAVVLKKSIRVPVGKLSSHSKPDPSRFTSSTSVSAQEMVQALEARRKIELGVAPAEALAELAKIPTGSGGGGGGPDPFEAGADPFLNKFEVVVGALESKLPGGGGSGAGYGQASASNRDTRGHYDREAGEKPIPDLQAQYLVRSAQWEKVTAKDVYVRNVTPKNMPKVAVLEHGLDRVLFNPGVHWLQDPRSSIYNFDPYLKNICQPENFDYDALPAYKTSSLDPRLKKVATSAKAKYIGSTSSMTSILSQFYFLISAWKPLWTNHLSGAFASQPKGFTRMTRAPVTIELVHKGGGMYAIDADKTFDSPTVLMQLGKSMEKMLTSTPEDFSRFTKANSHLVTKQERNQPEAFNYIAADKFVLRSQLDCEDPRLPGKTFDLKTRAAVAIRLDVHNYELNQGYQVRKAHGFLESFEREYYDMMRSAFLKYSLQVRIGQMDGIFVAFHNTAKIFGFQYISLDEMDSRLFGSSALGNEAFKNQLRLLNRALDEITAKYPNQDVKITADTLESSQTMNLWVETLPLGAATSEKGKDVEVVFDENGAPLMQPGAELSLWQIVCYSNVNNVDTTGPFDLSDSGRDQWILNYKIGELDKPQMANEYRRLRAVQAEIMAADNSESAAIKAMNENKDPDDSDLPPAVSAAAVKADLLKQKLRRISDLGRKYEAKAEKLNRDKEVQMWEPRGYVKESQLATVLKEIDELKKLVKSNILPPSSPATTATKSPSTTATKAAATVHTKKDKGAEDNAVSNLYAPIRGSIYAGPLHPFLVSYVSEPYKLLNISDHSLQMSLKARGCSFEGERDELLARLSAVNSYRGAAIRLQFYHHYLKGYLASPKDMRLPEPINWNNPWLERPLTLGDVLDVNDESDLSKPLTRDELWQFSTGQLLDVAKGLNVGRQRYLSLRKRYMRTSDLHDFFFLAICSEMSKDEDAMDASEKESLPDESVTRLPKLFSWYGRLAQKWGRQVQESPAPETDEDSDNDDLDEDTRFLKELNLVKQMKLFLRAEHLHRLANEDRAKKLATKKLNARDFSAIEDIDTSTMTEEPKVVSEIVQRDMKLKLNTVVSLGLSASEDVTKVQLDGMATRQTDEFVPDMTESSTVASANEELLFDPDMTESSTVASANDELLSDHSTESMIESSDKKEN